MGTTQKMSPKSSDAVGSPGMVSDCTAIPVQFPMPVKINALMPAETRQGSSTRSTWLPAKPTTSSMSTAATSGLPKIVAMAAADPATTSSFMPCGDWLSRVWLSAR